jgi:hypothetical protein
VTRNGGEQLGKDVGYVGAILEVFERGTGGRLDAVRNALALPLPEYFLFYFLNI